MKKPKKVIAYMDGTDWCHELGNAPSSTLYSTQEMCSKDSECVLQCGIVEVEVTFKRWVFEQDYSRKIKGEKNGTGRRKASKTKRKA